jgi:hypothetical protein
VVGKRPQLFSAYGMCRAIHPLPPYNTYFYIPFTLQRVSYTCPMCQFRVCNPRIHIGPQNIFVEVRRLQFSLHDRIDIPDYTMALNIIKSHYYDSLSSTVNPAGAQINTTKEENLG